MFETIAAGSLILFYLLHLSVSALLSGIIASYLTRRYKDHWALKFTFLLLFNLALPLIGYLFTLWIGYYLLHVEYAKVLKHTKMINMEDLDQEFPHVKRAFGEGSMVDLMANEMAPQELRMKALSTMAENMTQKNVSVIKNSLSEKDDEIRLYSFSLIDNMEQGINGKIHTASEKFKHSSSEKERISAARDLAFLYWEMIYFDLSDDILKAYLVGESYKYAKIVLNADINDTQINVLLGKIYLHKSSFEDATTHFVMAIESGIEHEYIIPYLAELYFKRGNYRSIRSMLREVQNLDMNATMHPVVAQWRDHG